MTTIYDIAVAAKVSTATVSRVINTPELVSEKTRAKVEEAIEKLHYAPNALARELVTKSTNLIGLLIPDIANSFRRRWWTALWARWSATAITSS